MAKQSNPDDITGKSWKIYLRLLRYAKPHAWLFALNVLGFMLVAATDGLLVQFTGFLMNALERTGQPPELAQNLPERDLKEPYSALTDNIDISIDWLPQLPTDLMLVPVIIVAIYLIRGIGLFVGSYCLALVAENVVHALRTELFNKLTVLPGAYFDKNDSGALISKITFNVSQVTVAVTDALKVFIREGLTFVVLMGLLFYLNWKLTLIFVAIAPVIGLLVAVAGRHLRRYSSKVQTAMGRLTSISGEMIGGYRVMRNYGGEAYEKERFKDASRETFRQNAKIAFTSNLASAINQFVVAVALGVLMFIALIIINPQGAAEIVMYMHAVGLLPKSLRQLSEVYNKIQRGLVAANSVFQQLDEAPEKETGTLELDSVQGRIEFRQLSFSYPATVSESESLRNALSDINLTIEPGEMVAFVGKSGSGKSTLVSLLPRYHDHEQGEILLDGREINDYTLKNLRQHMALVTQNVVLFNDTAKRNIAYGDLADKSDEEVKVAAEQAHAIEFIRELPESFDTQIGEDGARLSGGQRQRLSIARALLKDAPILILDEATSALDSESEQLIQDALSKVTRNRTTLVIAHRLSTIEQADKIVVMQEGRIVEVGNHKTLLSQNGAYAKLHAMQFRDVAE